MRSLEHCLAAFVVAILSCVTASAQSTLCTIPIATGNSNNWGNVGGCVFFDLEVKSGVKITGLTCNFSDLGGIGAPAGLNVYTTPGTANDAWIYPSLWTLAAWDNGTSLNSGMDLPTPITFATPLSLKPGKYGIALEGIGQGHQYTNGTGTNQLFSDANLTVKLGESCNVPFSAPIFTPRVWNGCIHYGPICKTKYGSGCQGSGGFVPDFDLGGCAVAGQTVTLNVTQGLGGATAVFLFGQGHGPLSMGGGCFLNFSVLFPLSIAVPLGGAGAGNGAVSLNGLMPPGTTGFTLAMQVFVQDPGGALGFSNSNGLEFIVQ